MQIRKSTPIAKPGKIILAPTKGRKVEERRRRGAQGNTSRGQDGDAADGPWDGRVENKDMEVQRRGRESDREDG